MNILIVAGSADAVSQLRPEYEMFISLAKAGHKLTIVLPADSVYTQPLKDQGIPVLHCYPQKKICLKTIRALRAELRKKPYDIIYATTSKTIPNCGFAAIGFPAKLVVYRGTTGGLYRHDPTAYLTILHPRVDGVICVSEAVRQDVLKRVWKNRSNVVTIHKGHDLGWYDHVPADLSEFGISTDDFVVICAVNVRPSKGIDIMLEATRQLDDLPQLHLILAGKGMDQEPYSSLVADSPMRERIHVAGFRTDAPELIAASDVLVQPSRSGEGLPRAVMEAMGGGTPVIITDTGGGKEVVQDGISGFVIDVEDPAAIAARVRTLHDDRKLTQRMAENARLRIQNDFSSARAADEFIAYFEALIATG